MEHIGLLTALALILAAFRLTRLVVADDVPFSGLRTKMVGTKIGELMTCPFCSSVWIGGFLAIGTAVAGDFVAWWAFVGAMALSGAVSLIASLLPQTFDA